VKADAVARQRLVVGNHRSDYAVHGPSGGKCWCRILFTV
jgi:hypothetical protein